jgi:hypothetical protein
MTKSMATTKTFILLHIGKVKRKGRKKIKKKTHLRSKLLFHRSKAKQGNDDDDDDDNDDNDDDDTHRNISTTMTERFLFTCNLFFY